MAEFDLIVRGGRVIDAASESMVFMTSP